MPTSAQPAQAELNCQPKNLHICLKPFQLVHRFWSKPTLSITLLIYWTNLKVEYFQWKCDFESWTSYGSIALQATNFNEEINKSREIIKTTKFIYKQTMNVKRSYTYIRPKATDQIDRYAGIQKKCLKSIWFLACDINTSSYPSTSKVLEENLHHWFNNWINRPSRMGFICSGPNFSICSGYFIL